MSRSIRRAFGAVVVTAGVLVTPVTALADHATNPHTQNMHAKGHSPHPATFLGEPDGVRHVNSDIAFRGTLAFHGNYDGFRIIDIADYNAGGWRVDKHPRFLADLTGDGRADIVGFGDGGVWTWHL